ncbi:MAG: formate hydrogenlyase transcriptional activator [Blastocatellia bacterium]|nr:formate hydrogenlyase transcriptional activator [Blastocatellia bacterium]
MEDDSLNNRNAAGSVGLTKSDPPPVGPSEHFNSVAQKRLPLGAELQLALNLIPAQTWYAVPSGALTFVNERTAEYLGLPKDHPLRFGIDTGAKWDYHIALLHPDDHEDSRKVWSTSLRTGCAAEGTFRVRNAESGYRWFLSRADPVRDANGTLLYWIGINLDIEERKWAEQELRDIVDTIPAIVWVALPDGSNTYVNSRFVEYSGMTPAQTAGSAWREAIHPDDLQAHETRWRASIATGEPHESEVRFRGADGAYRWHVDRGFPLRAEDGNIIKWYGIVTDIEARKRVEEALRRNEHCLAEAQRLSHVGSVGMDVSTKRIFWSEESARIYGYAPGTKPTPELILQRVHPEDVGLVTDAIKRAGLGGDDFDYEHRLLMPDGSIKHIYNLAHCYRDDTGNAEVLGAIMDITERKVSEEAIRRSEAYLAEAQRLSHTGSFGWKPDDGEIVWSDETYRIFEYDSTLKPTVDSVVQRVHPSDRALAHQVIERVSKTGTDFEHEYRLLLADGRVKHIHAIAHAVENASGQREFIGAVTDITERKTAEEKVRSQEAELRQMLDLAPQIIVLVGPRQERLYANRFALAYLGVSLEEWRTRSFLTEVHPDDVDRVKAFVDRSAAHPADYEWDLRLRKGDGTYRWFLVRYNPLRDGQGQLVRWYLACTDIEDRKRSEERLQRENAALREEIDETSMFEEIVGTSPALQTVLSSISKVAPTDSTVLITGETGTGKELVARAIHRRSGRTSRAFISVNCAAIPRDLISSELFGHEKGAFTGATQRRLGRFELADGGTIFLDEVGELSPDTQVALLRVLQEREFERVGGRQPIHVDVRVVAATNRDLKAAVADGTFRQDLFYRLNVFPIEVPPLRERKDDLLMLVEYFVQRYAKRAGKNIRSIDQKALALLQSYDWPGNIRELQNIIERSVILSAGEVFSVDESWLSKESSPKGVRLEASEQSTSGVKPRGEREMIESVLVETKGRVWGPSGAAAKLGIPPSTLDHRIKALRIDKKQFKYLLKADQNHQNH